MQSRRGKSHQSRSNELADDQSLKLSTFDEIKLKNCASHQFTSNLESVSVKKAGLNKRNLFAPWDWKVSPKKFRQAGNTARDIKDWAEASTSYGRYLDLVGDDADIWIQYGHALKESGFLVDAENAYRRALTLQPSDVETRVHLAHLLKRMKQPENALRVFEQAMELSPTIDVIRDFQDLIDQSTSKRILHAKPDRAATNGIYLELKDLFQYLGMHTTVTGITRVTLGLINYILEYMEPERASKYSFVHQFGDAEGAMLISHANMRRVVALALSDAPDLQKMQELIGLLRSISPIIHLAEGDCYLIVGAFWEFVGNPSWIGGMRSRGVRIGAYIYDLIPITHHQYCMQGLTDAFTLAFAETARLLDFALTISSFVATQVTDFLASHHIAPCPTVPVPLAHELRFELKTAKHTLVEPLTLPDDVSTKKQYLNGIPFVLCVCTIEARKNHAYLFVIWQRMIEAKIDVPDLVFVGRPGWRVSDLLDQINESNSLDGRLHILNGLTDEELSGLYDRCLFTVFPSFVEGWGLPVGESLAHGKVCVASSSSSIPEVGGDHAIYVDPFDIDSGYQVISELICNRAEVTRMQDRIKAGFVARTWKDVGHDFFAKLETLNAHDGHDRLPRPFFSPNLRSGELINVASMGRIGARGAEYVQNPDRLAFVSGWRAVESTGTWMLDDTAQMRVQTDCIPGQTVLVLLHVGTSPWVGRHNTLHIESPSLAAVPAGPERQIGYRRPMRSNEDLWLTIIGQVDELGGLPVQFRVTGPILPTDPGAIAVGLRFRELSYTPASDTAARVAMLERALLSPGSALLHP